MTSLLLPLIAILAAAPTPPEPIDDAIAVYRGLEFAVNPGGIIALDLYVPRAAKEPLPCIVVIPGGAFLPEKKRKFADEAEILARAGFAAASVGYRGWPGDNFPAAVHDVKAAVRFLRAKAGIYALDASRIGAFGQSAGGYLAGMLAVTGDDAAMEGTGGNAGVSSRVQAAVCFSGLFDFIAGDSPDPEQEGGSIARRSFNRLWIGASLEDDRARWEQASPYYHLTPDDAPILFVHSRKDSIVPWYQSQRMYDGLKELRPESKILLLEKGGHNIRDSRKVKDEAWVAAIAFFREQLLKPQAELPFVPVVAPTHADVAYGPYKRNVMDVWLADSDVPTPVLVSIHGGGFRGGNKTVSNRLLTDCLESGISVVTITYRLTDEVMAPVPFHDAARALQYIRSQAATWNIDPKRIAANGDSAGAGISLWLGLHDDRADPDNADPVLRQSTRLACVAVENGQSSYDPRFIRKLIPEMSTWEHPALEYLFGIKAAEIDQLSEEKSRLMDEVAAIAHVGPDDPPVLLTYNSAADAPVTSLRVGIHHPRFGFALKEKLDAVGVPCEVACGFEGEGELRDALIMTFLKKWLLERRVD